MVIKKKSEKNWEYCVYIGQDENGKKKYKRKCGFKTKKACIEEAAILANPKTKNNKKTFREICYIFLEDCKIRGLRNTTIITYNTQIKFILKNFKLSDKDIRKIKVNDIHEFINSRINLYHGIFKRRIIEFLKYIFSYAQKNKFINNNIFDEIKLPPINRTNRNIWSEVEIQEYLPILRNFKYFDIVLLTLETGMRRGEVIGLTWDCVDFNKGIITVNKSYTIHSGFIGMHTPKTNSGTREIVLLNESFKILKKRYKNRTSKYVFPSDKNNNIPVNPMCVSNYFRNFLNKHNIKPIRFHDLRHTHATLLLNKNINYKILSKRLGHSNISFTLQTYTHIVPEHEIQLFKTLSKIF